MNLRTSVMDFHRYSEMVQHHQNQIQENAVENYCVIETPVERLLKLCGITVPGGADGKYGPGTAQAVVEFIEKYGDEFGLTMCPYGENGELTYVDEKTLAAMYEVAKREGPAIIQANYNGPTGGLDLDGSTVQNKNDWLEWAVAQNGFKEAINPGDSEGNNNTPFGLFTSSNGGAWCA